MVKRSASRCGQYAKPTLELFGVSRCMFESNYPVDRSVAGYGVLWNTFKRMTAELPESARQALFHDNAAAFYRI